MVQPKREWIGGRRAGE